MKKFSAMLLLVSLFAMPWAAGASGQPKRADDGKYLDPEGEPTYHIGADGIVDWYTYSGFRRYHSECHVCHGPDGLGSSFAPGLIEPMKTMPYSDFLQVVVNGRENVTTSMQRKMPAFGENKNVMCFIDDLYVYLKARADGALGRDRPQKREPKPEAAQAAEKACFSE